MEVMDKASYTEGLDLSILPEGHKYSFHSIEVISELDENGELQIDIDGRVDVGNIDGVKMFLEEFYTSFTQGHRAALGRTPKLRPVHKHRPTNRGLILTIPHGHIMPIPMKG